MINKNYNYAVIGASTNPEKYGFKVLKDLLDGGYKVIPINPKGGEILGIKVFTNIDEVTEKIDVAIMIVPPEIGLKILPQLKEQSIDKVWFQPGSENEAMINYCKENEVECVTNACIMIRRKDI
jgi:uncharacterized protein